jgi:hypothetical protein
MHPAGDSAPEAKDLGYLMIGTPDRADVYDCTTMDGANITWMDIDNGRQYSVQKDFKGVSGTINIQKDRNDVIVGHFDAKLGWWDFEQNHFPTQDPPDDTITFSGGLIRVSGKIPTNGLAGPATANPEDIARPRPF